jgi:nucleoside-diphosphate-sugar epimerase
MSTRRVLITGRYGFTGRYAADALSAAGWEVWGLGSQLPDGASGTDRAADLTDKASLSKVIDEVCPDAVLHLAAVAFVGHGNVDDFYQVNLIGSRNLLGALDESGHAQSGVVLASSANIYGNTRISPIAEATVPAPANDYAVSKLAMEHVAQLFVERLPITIARPFNYTGVGQDPKFLVPKIVSHFRDRAVRMELGNLDVARDFSDVRDVAQAYCALLDSEKSHGETVNICSGRATELGQIIDMCKAITGHDLEVAVNPNFVRSDEIKTLNGDRSHLDALIGSSERHSLEDTLRWMLSA